MQTSFQFFPLSWKAGCFCKTECHVVSCCLFSWVQSLSRVWLFVTPWTPARQASLSITNSRSLPKAMSVDSFDTKAISYSVVPFSSRPQSFPASGSFQRSQLFASGGQSFGFSVSTTWAQNVTHRQLVLCVCVCVYVQLLSCVRLFATPWTAAFQASLSFTLFWNLLKFMSIDWVNDAI